VIVFALAVLSNANTYPSDASDAGMYPTSANDAMYSDSTGIRIEVLVLLS